MTVTRGTIDEGDFNDTEIDERTDGNAALYDIVFPDPDEYLVGFYVTTEDNKK
jgi:hypothetical protein